MWYGKRRFRILDLETPLEKFFSALVVVGLAAALAARDLPADVPVVTLATAHAAKFRDAVERATGIRPPLPTRLADLYDREERFSVLPNDLGAIEATVRAHARRNAA